MSHDVSHLSKEYCRSNAKRYENEAKELMRIADGHQMRADGCRETADNLLKLSKAMRERGESKE